MESKNMTLNCNSKILEFNNKKIMGILNISSDSFYDGGNYTDLESATTRVSEMINEGADIIDLGAVTSKPGSEIINGLDELKIVSKFIDEISLNFSKIILSIDTYNSEVAEYALNKGFSIINDISAGKYDERLIDVVKDYNAGYVLMHMKGDPSNMQLNPEYSNVYNTVFDFFEKKIEILSRKGINNIIIDPGFGFGKTIDHNFELLEKLNDFKVFKKPILVGLSRKSMIYKYLNLTPNDSLNGTTTLNTIALEKGANILRVHDVKEANECKKLLEKLN
ncbi:MAG: dihydropteroate synthase [Bacteroidota bacterium]